MKNNHSVQMKEMQGNHNGEGGESGGQKFSQDERVMARFGKKQQLQVCGYHYHT